MSDERLCGEVVGYDFDEVFKNLMWYLYKYPEHTSRPRGKLVRECLATTLVLQDPGARTLRSVVRNANYGFAVGEFLWYWSGRNDLESLLYYNKRAGDYSDDGKTINSAYGHRLRTEVVTADQKGETLSQWDVAVETLVDDPDSRRAILLINRPEDEARAVLVGSKDVPCTLSLQFFIRENALHLHVVMRSNDVIWGLTNDLFSFTLFQECMLLELRQKKGFERLQLGTYYHTAGSMHLYERHFEMAKGIIEEYRAKGPAAPKMGSISSLEDLDRLSVDAELLRTGVIDHINVDRYRDGLKWSAERLNEHRKKRDREGRKAERTAS